MEFALAPYRDDIEHMEHNGSTIELHQCSNLANMRVIGPEISCGVDLSDLLSHQSVQVE
jgi:hypothetical protein